MGRLFRIPVFLLQGSLLLMAVAVSPGEGAAVAALETYKAYLCRKFPQNTTFPEDFPNGDMSSMGVCVMARPEDTQPNNPSYILSFNSADVTVAAGIDDFALWMGVNEDNFTLNETLEAGVWNMVCVGLSTTHAKHTAGEEEAPLQAYQAWASLHGRLLEVPLGANISEWEEGVRVCVGAWKASFTGFVTGVTVLAGEGELTPANCSVLLEANELTVPLNDSWTTLGPVLILDEEVQESCVAPVHTVLLEGLLGYHKFLRMCHSLGGHFPTEEEAATGQVETFNCSSGEYLSWMSSNGVRQEGPTARCPVLEVGGGTGRRPCLSELQCTLCQVPAGLRYTLFGPSTDFDRYYSLRILPDGSFDFLGNETSSIQRNASGWILQSRLHSEELNQNMWVMGRRPWYSSSPGHDAVNLTFTVCNAIQFSSNDGVCLLKSQRCDGRNHSPDKSDEVGCGSQRFISKYAYYDTSVNPFSGQKQKGTLQYELNLRVIAKMRTEDDIARMEVNLYIGWTDDRLSFVDTKMGRNAFPCEDIWTPELNIFAGYNKGPAVRPDWNRTDCYLNWRGKPLGEQHLDDPLMGRYYSKARIVQYNNLMLTYPCLLKVWKYPFGRYVCNITFSIFGSFRNMKWMEQKEPNTLQYKGDKDLLDYLLEKVTVEVHDSELTLTLHLAGQPDYHLTNSFLPSSLMFLICYSSFFFPIAGFNERIMVSLTSLLVLVALFSQAVESYVKTPYYKLIDVWYVALILLCFHVVTANGVVNYLRVQKVKSHEGIMKKILLAKRVNLGSQVLIMGSFVTMVIIFGLFSCDVF